jgi:hypothetical protein
MTCISNNLSFDDGFDVAIMDNILRLLTLTYSKKSVSTNHQLCLTTFYRLLKNWNKQIEEKVVWPKIAHTIIKMKPFVNYNITETKINIKRSFLNG